MSVGLYIHLPFCRVHCAYCPFAISTDLRLQERYVETLIGEIERRGAGEKVDTIYFGGGTPSRTDRQHLAAITRTIHRRFAVEPQAEFSLEANPEDVSAESLAAWRSLGVNRISIGVQSFSDNELQAIGRVHDAARARQAIRYAVATGVRTSADLILGLPEQTELSFRESLCEAIDSGIGHLSLYMLDLDEETALKHRVEAGVVRVPDDEQVAPLYIEAVDTLARAGFRQYEISNFARPGEESQHNLRYWRRQPYHGFGLGAHSFVGERRFANTRDMQRYLDHPSTPEFVEQLTESEARREMLFLQLRQSSGIHYEEVVRLCGKEAVEWIEDGVSGGWLQRDGSRVAFTPAGFLVSSTLIAQLF
jgi:oxygen-independent coproporphyrinogen-3 oxidase